MDKFDKVRMWIKRRYLLKNCIVWNNLLTIVWQTKYSYVEVMISQTWKHEVSWIDEIFMAISTSNSVLKMIQTKIEKYIKKNL